MHSGAPALDPIYRETAILELLGPFCAAALPVRSRAGSHYVHGNAALRQAVSQRSGGDRGTTSQRRILVVQDQDPPRNCSGRRRDEPYPAHPLWR
jgi:hypothetical protein